MATPDLVVNKSYSSTPTQDHNTEMSPKDQGPSETSTHFTLSSSEEDNSLGEKSKDAGFDQRETVVGSTEDDYPHGARLAIVVAAIALSTFIVALDSTIIGTVIPKITDEFQGLDKVSWYGSAYFMTFGGFQSSWGKVYKYFPLKPAFLAAMFIFEVGSLVCAVAPSATALIVGRAIAGLGGAGVSTGAFTIIGLSAPPETRPTLTGITGSSYGVAAVCGPLIGGAFTVGVTWRWCFYINLPIGGIAALIIFILFQTPSTVKPVPASWREKIEQLDLIGVALVMGLIVSFILAFSYGGQTKAWNSSTVIGLLVGFILISIAFVLWEIFQGECAMIPGRLLGHRMVLLSSIYAFLFAGSYVVILYYLPIYFQSVQGVSAIGSGVHNLPTLIAVIIFATSTGGIVAKTGHAVPIMVIGSTLAAIAAGLFYTFSFETSSAKWIGYQIIGGVGWGGAYQIPIIIAQSQSDPSDMAVVTAIIMFAQQIGGAVCLSAAQGAFMNRMLNTAMVTVPSISSGTLIETGATQIRSSFTTDEIHGVLLAYLAGLKVVWAIVASLVAASAVSTLFNSWGRLRPAVVTAEAEATS
ncbi:putative efflux pump antibiotic resistance protein [Xylariales sp. PMI_506]|nr:putative efflux pump antibiotic resistance protein [Xylariales sp. PMI_506]